MALTDALRTYKRSSPPQSVEDLRIFISDELTKVEQALKSVRETLQALDTTKTNLTNAANDAAAAAAGVALFALYHNGGAVRVRLV